MANDYYAAPAEKTPLTTIRSAERNSDASAVEAGFDTLPNELDVKRSQYGQDVSTAATLYEVTIPNLVVAYYEGLEVTFQATFENTGVANMSVNGQTIEPIVDATGNGIVAGSIKADQAVTVVYVLSPITSFQLISTAASAQDVQDAKEAAEAAEASADRAEASSSFSLWNGTDTFNIPTIVQASNDRFYQTLIDSNTGNDPVSSPTVWEEQRFIRVYNASANYITGQIAQIADGRLWRSLVTPNINNEPSIDDGTNWDSVNTSLDWVNDRTYFVGKEAISLVDNRTYKSVITQSGNEPSVDDGTNWLPIEGKVTKPVNSSPADEDTGVSRTPTLISSAYAITGGTSNHEFSDYNLYLDAGRTNLVHNSDITNNLINHKITDRLEPATEYFWETLHKGDRTDSSEFSDLTSFTTTIDFSEVFDNVLFDGISAALSVITTVDLSANTGSIWIVNTVTTATIRLCDTVAGVGVAITAGAGFNEVSEVNGLTAFNFNGFSVGNDAAYNNSGDSIFSLSFKVQVGIHDIVLTTGDSINRTVPHSIGKDIAFMLNVQLTGAQPAAGNNFHFCWFKDLPPSQHYEFNELASANTDSTVWNSTAPTSSVFSLGTSLVTNGLSRTYKTYLWAHNPEAGLFGGSWTGTGLAGNKIFLGDDFKTNTIIWKPRSGIGGLFDKKFGTSTHLQMSSFQPFLISGGPESFDSDGFTVGDTANIDGRIYDFFAFVDPDLF